MAEEKLVEVGRLRMKILPDDQNAQGPLRECVDEYRSRRENEFDALPFDQQIVRLKETVGYLSRRCEAADLAAVVAATTQGNLHSIITESTARERDLRAQLAAKDEEIKAAFRPYLKDGETPIERLERERADNDMLLGLLAAEKAKVREAFAAGRQSRCAFRQGERRWFFGSSEATTKTAEGFTAWLAQRHQEQEKP